MNQKRKIDLNHIDVERFCKSCGLCCKQLDLLDNIKLSMALRKVVLGKTCPARTKNGCGVYAKRPKLCRDWRCGVTELSQICRGAVL